MQGWGVLAGPTLAAVAGVEPGAVPGAHGRIDTGHGGRVELRQLAALLIVGQIFICVVQEAGFSVQTLPTFGHWGWVDGGGRKK